MTNSIDVQRAYAAVYAQMRNYVWQIDILETLADVEVEAFNDFIEKDTLVRAFDKLKREIKEVSKEDEELQSALDEFDKTVSDLGDGAIDIYVMEEVPNEDKEN